nr:hypothetical protein [Tanacetum cinerariifolium]
GMNLDEGEAAAERVRDDTEEMATVLTSMDAIIVLASGVAEVPTGSGSIPTAGPPAAEVPTGSYVVPTNGPIFSIATVVTPYTRRKGKEIMVESETPKKKKIQEQMDIQMARQLEEEMERDAQMMNEQIARDAEIVRIHVEEELQIMIDGLDIINETVAKYLQKYHQFATELPLERRIELISDLVRYQDNYAKVYKFQTQQRKPWSKKQKRDYYMAVIKSNLGSKEEAEMLKRKGLSLEQESVKKLKTSEEVLEDVKSPDEVLEEKVKELMQLVLIEEVYVEALQVKHPIIDWKVHTEGQRSYWKITRLGGSSASYQFFVDMLKHLDREDLNQLWALVKESLSNRPPTSDKDMELWMYDTCGVHHVTAKDKEIFMLVEKDYPLRKGLAIGMISYKLQGRIVGNKMHKAFPLPVIEFLLPEEVPTASEESSHCQKKRKATAVKIALLLKSKRNCQSKLDDSYTNSAILMAVASLFFWQWELSSLVVGISSASGNFITGSGNALCILFPIDNRFNVLRKSLLLTSCSGTEAAWWSILFFFVSKLLYGAIYLVLIYGLVFSIWILESCVQRILWWHKEANVIPRALAWSRKEIFYGSDYKFLFGKEFEVNIDLTATISELKSQLYINFRDFFMVYLPRNPPIIYNDLYEDYLNKLSASRKRAKIATKDLPTIPRCDSSSLIKEIRLNDNVIT